MKGLKDFLYDKNDIVIALVILVIAALLIVWRMDAIMNYPHTLAQETGTTDTTDTEAVPNENTGDSPSSLWADGVLSKDVKVDVEGGSATAAVQSLIDAGLFTSYEQFTKVCKAAGCTPEDIKATTFTFEAGCTQTDIAKKVTQ